MGFKFVFLWTDIALYALFAVLVFYVWRVVRQPNLQATWKKVMHDPAALSAGVVLAIFALITAFDSVHYRRALESTAGSTTVYYDTRTVSLLDALLSRQIEMREVTYSRPLSYEGINKESITVNGTVVRDYPRLVHGGVHLKDPQVEWSGDVSRRLVLGLLGGMAAFGVLMMVFGLFCLGWFIWTIVLLYRYGQTIGKKVLGIRVVRMDGSRVSFPRFFFLRWLGMAVLGAIFGAICGALHIRYVGNSIGLIDALFIFGAAHRCLHDYIADTQVVTAESSTHATLEGARGR